MPIASSLAFRHVCLNNIQLLFCSIHKENRVKKCQKQNHADQLDTRVKRLRAVHSTVADNQ